MWANRVKIVVKSFPPSNNRHLFVHRRSHYYQQPSSYNQDYRKSNNSGNLDRFRSCGWCCWSSGAKTAEQSYSSYSAELIINRNKLVAIFEEGFNRGSVGSAREPRWMEV